MTWIPEQNSRTFNEVASLFLMGTAISFYPSHVIGDSLDEETIKIWPNKLTIFTLSSSLINPNMSWFDEIIENKGRFRFMTGPNISSGSYSGTLPTTTEWVDILAAYRKEILPDTYNLYFVIDWPATDSDSGVFSTTLMASQQLRSGWALEANPSEGLNVEAVDISGDDVIKLKENEVYIPEAWNTTANKFSMDNNFKWNYDYKNILKKESITAVEGFVKEAV
jgi:hypothetical protein